MRKLFSLAAIAAATLLAACVFESATPLVPPADYATPLAPGNYAVMQRQDSGEFTKDSDAKLSVAKNIYTMTNSDGPMNFALYRISPKTFLAQVSDKPDENVYLILEMTPEGAAVTTLQCEQLNADERTRFHLSLDSKDSCTFTDLDDLVTAAMYLKGRGETPAMKLVKQ
jgi:hypothetical protein